MQAVVFIDVYKKCILQLTVVLHELIAYKGDIVNII